MMRVTGGKTRPGKGIEDDDFQDDEETAWQRN
jgi:hypothetical protein